MMQWRRVAVALLGIALPFACLANGQQRGALPTEDEFARARHRLVRLLRSEGIDDERVLAAIESVPRHEFVDAGLTREAYANRPLPIGHGQTISQPYIVALMTQLLAPDPGDRVLEIGTGSGYQAAILAELECEVYTVEIVPELAERAAETLRRLGVRGVHQRVGDGYEGWPEHAPYDGVIVTAAPERVPDALVQQLRPGGRLVIPVGARDAVQTLQLFEKKPDGSLVERDVIPVRFVPMVHPRRQ